MAISRKQLVKMLTKDFETSQSDSSYTLKRQCDRLANYAYIALSQLEEEGRLDFIMLKHDGMREWWTEHKESIEQQRQAEMAKQRKAELKARALAKLSDEEKAALGIKR